MTANWDKTECPSGHPYSPENTYRRPKTGQRMCRICRTESKRTSRVKAKENTPA